MREAQTFPKPPNSSFVQAAYAGRTPDLAPCPVYVGAPTRDRLPGFFGPSPLPFWIKGFSLTLDC